MTIDLPRATAIAPFEGEQADQITLSFDDRYRRRMVMTCDGGLQFLLDLPTAKQMQDGDNLRLSDGRHIRVRAGDEDLLMAYGSDELHLIKTAWHIGNRHLPCEIHADRLVLRWDHVIADMLRQQGCVVTRVKAPFNPEGGAYGHGRTHDHGSSHGYESNHGQAADVVRAHDHDHDQEHDHNHDQD